MKIYSINDKEFLQYGKVLDGAFYEAFKKASDEIAVPQDGSAYRASEPTFERTDVMAHYRNRFGGMDVQIGYCWGKNNALNALEWHKNSEIAVALTDLIMLFGDLREMQDGTYDTSKIKAFFFKEGQSAEIYATTLHFCPLGVNGKAFKNVVILPRGTNTPLEMPSDDKMLISKNKWLIVHPDFTKQVELGRVVGLVGENIVME
jgi:hypothetical protein